MLRYHFFILGVLSTTVETLPVITRNIYLLTAQKKFSSTLSFSEMSCVMCIDHICMDDAYFASHVDA